MIPDCREFLKRREDLHSPYEVFFTQMPGTPYPFLNVPCADITNALISSAGGIKKRHTVKYVKKEYRTYAEGGFAGS
ncbi:MAG: hypothetical protein ACE5FU_03870 [Nitrospinota bacterium]